MQVWALRVFGFVRRIIGSYTLGLVKNNTNCLVSLPDFLL